MGYFEAEKRFRSSFASSLSDPLLLNSEKGAEIWPLIASGRIRPVMAATFLLEKVADAHRLMEKGNHIGKIVLIV